MLKSQLDGCSRGKNNKQTEFRNKKNLLKLDGKGKTKIDGLAGEALPLLKTCGDELLSLKFQRR